MMIADDLLSTFPNTVCTAIKDRLSGLNKCQPIDGRLNLAEILKLGVQDPSVFVSMLGVAKASGPGFGSAPELEASMVAFVVTKDARRVERAIAITQAIFSLIYDNRWGVAQLGPAQRIRAQVVTSTATRSQNTTLWAVTWAQPFVPDFEGNAAPLDIAIYLPPLDDPDAAPVQLTGGAP